MTEPQARPNRERNRVGLTFTDDELYAIDDWGFAHKLRSRSEVIRRLVRMALTLKTETATSEPASSI